MVAVPRREVDAEAEAVAAAGIRQVAHHVALAVAPGRVLDAVFGIGRGPQAEAVVVLGRQHDSLHAGSLERADPLVAVQVGRGECRGGRIAVAPLHVVEGVESVMDKGIGLELLPGNLPGIGQRTDRCGRLHAGAGPGQKQQKGQQFFHVSQICIVALLDYPTAKCTKKTQTEKSRGQYFRPGEKTYRIFCRSAIFPYICASAIGSNQTRTPK